MNAQYDDFAPFYDLEYDHKDNDLPFYLSLAKRYHGPVLEIGAGTGRITFPIARQGQRIIGIDNSHAMLKIAKQKLLGMNTKVRSRIGFLAADMRRFTLQTHFNLCISPFRTFLHNLTIADQLATLRSVHHHLADQGILALDLFVPLYTVLSRLEWADEIEEQDLAHANSGISIQMHIRHIPEQQLLKIKNTYLENTQRKNRSGVTLEMQYRYIFRYEMELLLRMVGFHVLHVYGGFEEQPYDFHSGMMVFVAKKASETPS